MIVVADTSAICYLLILDYLNILPELYNSIVIPEAVAEELSATESPSVVRNWIIQPPNWLTIYPVDTSEGLGLEKIHQGEQESILLAENLNAELIILDDKAARRIAVERGLAVIGLLGVLKDASRADLLDLPTAFKRLQETGFWVAPSLLEQLLQED